MGARARASGCRGVARCLSGLVLGFSLCASVAGAQQSPPKGRDTVESLYAEATAALDREDYAAACPKLEEVTRLRPDKLIAHFKLGGCYVATGKLGSAWSRFVLVRNQAREAGNAGQAEAAATKLAELKPRIGTLTILVPKDVRDRPGFSLTLDGKAVDPAVFDQPSPVDSGTHLLVARSADHDPWQKTVAVADGENKRLRVLAGISLVDDPATAAEPAPSFAFTHRRSLVLAGVGVVSAGFAVGLGVQSTLDFRALAARCNGAPGTCRDVDAAPLRGMLTGANVMWGVAGAAAVAAGIVFFAVERNDKTSVSVTPTLGGAAVTYRH